MTKLVEEPKPALPLSGMECVESAFSTNRVFVTTRGGGQ
jgi:hypothetical protein